MAPAEPLLANPNRVNPELDDAVLVPLADAVDRQRDALITYRNKTGNRTTRPIRPQHRIGHHNLYR
ncbi:MAG: hypothetical protein ACJ72N_07115 [Labedaea sp.]